MAKNRKKKIRKLTVDLSRLKLVYSKGIIVDEKYQGAPPEKANDEPN